MNVKTTDKLGDALFCEEQVHCGDQAGRVHLVLKNKVDELPRLVAWLDQLSEIYALPPALAVQLNLVLEEWLVNIISYAYSDRQAHDILISFWRDEASVSLEIQDDGKAYNPLEQHVADTTLPLECRSIGGLGIHFIRKIMTTCQYTRDGSFNILTMNKLINDMTDM
ncbi:MAG: ATP-binding protein [Spartobacteria bacterium]|nr:ATP-binding protein [Spartobacteria bacterium]